jgi:hypothetical protein
MGRLATGARAPVQEDGRDAVRAAALLHVESVASPDGQLVGRVGVDGGIEIAQHRFLEHDASGT